MISRLENNSISPIQESSRPQQGIEHGKDQSHELLRSIAKDRGLPLQDERLAIRTRANRTDSRALVNFALAFGKAPTTGAIVNYLNRRDFKEREVIKDGLVGKSLKELVDQDLVKRSKYGKTVLYEPFVYSDEVGLDSAHLTDISLRYPVRLSSLLGEAEPTSIQMPSANGEVRDGLQYTLDRINTLLYLDCLGQLTDADIPLSVTQAEAADTLDIRPDSLKRHLRSLGNAGVLNYFSVDTKDGAYQTYRPVDLKDQTPNTPAGWIRIYARQNGGVVTPEGVTSFYFDGLADDVPEEQRNRFMYQVRRSLQHLAATGELAKIGPLEDLDKSLISLAPESFQRGLVGDLASAFSAMNSHAPEARRFGRNKGERLTKDWRGITKLLDKAEVDNLYYTSRIKNTGTTTDL